MADISVTVSAGANKYPAKYMRIKSTRLGREDHGFLTFNLDCEGSGSGIGVGNYTLDSPPSEPGGRREPTASGMALIDAVIRTVGVDSWESLQGKTVYVLFAAESTMGPAVGIANPETGATLVFSEFLKDYRD